MNPIQTNRSRPGPAALVALAATVTIGGAIAGCHRPQGAFLSFTGEAQTYHSTELSPKTVSVVDVRSNETIFEIAIPPGKQLVVDFVEDGGDDPSLRPASMRYDIMDINTSFGRLTQSVSVPGAGSRRVEVDMREGVEYAETPPEYRLRPDRVEDRPPWWSPEGGERPDTDATKTTLYDG